MKSFYFFKVCWFVEQSLSKYPMYKFHITGNSALPRSFSLGSTIIVSSRSHMNIYILLYSDQNKTTKFKCFYKHP